MANQQHNYDDERIEYIIPPDYVRQNNIIPEMDEPNNEIQYNPQRLERQNAVNDPNRIEQFQKYSFQIGRVHV